MYVGRTRELFYENTKTFVTLWKVRNIMCSCSISESKSRIVFNEKVSISESCGDLDFAKLLLESVDEGLSLLGYCSKQALYSHLENNLKIRKQDIPEKIEQFSDAIEKIFGHSAKLLEIEIMKNLFKRLEHSFEYPAEKDNLIFIKYVKAARASARIPKKVSSSLYKLT
jgi:hypothetical protein